MTYRHPEALVSTLLWQLGHEEVSVHDASMSEWARDPGLPVETG